MDEEKERQRAAWRSRQQRSRKNRADAEAEKELADLRQRDPVAARIQEIWAEAMAKPITKPGVPLPDPGPARLPTLAEMLKWIEQPRTEATRLMSERYKAAIQVGAVTFEDFEQLRQRALDKFGHFSAEAIIAAGGVEHG